MRWCFLVIITRGGFQVLTPPFIPPPFLPPLPFSSLTAISQTQVLDDEEDNDVAHQRGLGTDGREGRELE